MDQITIAGIVTLFGFHIPDSSSRQFFTTSTNRDEAMEKADRTCKDMPDHDFPRNVPFTAVALLSSDGRYFLLEEINTSTV